MEYILPDLNHLIVKSSASDDGKSGKFIIEPLSPGYGVTIGNTLRRILLASLEGSAVRNAKIAGVSHEFSAIKGIKEDTVDLILNLKTMRTKVNGDNPVKLELSVKGPKRVTAGDFKRTSEVDVIDNNHYIATVEKGGKLDLEVEVAKGRGYEPVEKRTEEKLPVGTIMIDSIYTPVKKVKYEVENARVGDVTNYNRLVMDITTDDSITPAEALKTASSIMIEHLQVIADACKSNEIVEKPKAKKTKKPARKK